MTSTPADTSRRRRLIRRYAVRMAPAMVLSHTAGGFGVFWFLNVIDAQQDDAGVDPLVYRTVFAAYMGAATLLGILGSVLICRRLLRWVQHRDDRDVSGDLGDVVGVPVRLVQLYATIWVIGALIFAGLALSASVDRAGDVLSGTALGGLVTCALSGLLAERYNRPLVAEAMRDRTDAPPLLLSVRRRLLLAWALGTGVPVFAIAMGVRDPNGSGQIGDKGVITLSLVALASGLLLTEVAARAVAEPIGSVTGALAEVAQGNLGVRVPVDDASEIGQLQAGVNAMVRGLRERDRIQDLYGRQVGPDVARLAVEEGVRLGGERREVTVLFVDVVGSTTLAAELEPEEVVARLNAFFAVVIEVVTRHGGWVNKFEGDAALCIFGAPEPLEDPTTAVLRAARELAAGLAPLPLASAVGASGGPVVAGHVGAESRFEYTVIGDPVNAAARLTELAKGLPGRVLVDAALLEGCTPQEAARWVTDEDAVLRGRATVTRTAVPKP